jgi:hypothetical protein
VTLDPDGTKRITLVPPGPGTWRVRAAGLAGEAPLVASDLFAAGPLPDEIGESEPALRQLSSLAKATKGHTAGADLPDVHALPFRPEVVARVGVSADEPLWNHPLVFLILLAVLGLEWFVERKIGYT